MSEGQTFDFAEMTKQRREGMLLIPHLSAYLYNADFPDEVTVTFKKGDSRRPSDGWFWPSTHPTWPLRALWLYLNEPETLPTEDREYMNTLALTMGTAIHTFIETCLRHMGLRTPELNTCTSCSPEKECQEPGFADHEVGSRGHMDGILDLSPLKPLPVAVPEIVGFEFKTGSDRVISGLNSMDLETYRRRHPVYYGQNQEYMALSGRRMVIVLFMGLGWPWPMREIHVPFDPAWVSQTREKYYAARAADSLPACCGMSKCVLKNWCKVHKEPERAFLMPRSSLTRPLKGTS